MASRNRYPNLDDGVLRHIRGTARLLTATNAVPGMDFEDFEQDLVLDLWRRSESYDPARSSFRTFANTVVAHRVATLTVPSARTAAERASLSLDALVTPDPDLSCRRFGDLPELVDDRSIALEITVGLRVDLARFLGSLTPALRRCCEIILSGNIKAASAAAGLHRSSLYESTSRLREQAVEAGLHAYL